MSNTLTPSYLTERLPLLNYPWLSTALVQDSFVHSAAVSLLNLDLSPSPQPTMGEITPAEWSPAAIGLRIITLESAISSLTSYPMLDVNEDIQKHAFKVSSNIVFPDQDWSLEKAIWMAIAIRSDYLLKGDWESVLNTWFSDPHPQHGTVLACLFGVVPEPTEIFRTLLKRDPSAINIALTIHAILANPIKPEEQLEQIIAITSDKENACFIPTSAKLVFLHIINNQRPTLAHQLANFWSNNQEFYPSNQKWSYQDPLTWFHELQSELFQATTKQIMTLEPDPTKVIQRWRKSCSTLDTAPLTFSTLSELVDAAHTAYIDEPQYAFTAAQKANQYLIDFIGKIPIYLLADSRLVALVQELSELFFSFTRPSLSVQILSEACKLQPTNSSLLILLARSQLKSHQPQDAISSLTTALLLSPTRSDIYTTLAECLEQTENWHVALPMRQALLEAAQATQKPDLTRELYALANRSICAQKTEIAFQAIQHLLNNNPNDGIAYYYYGRAYHQQGKPSEALINLTKATELSYDQTLPWLGLAEFHISSGDEEHAIATLQAAIQAIPDSAQINCRLGEIHLSRNSYTQAEAVLSHASQLDPGNSTIAYHYGLTLRRLGHTERAKEAILNSLAHNPEDQKLAFLLAETLIDLRMYEEALPYLEAIISNRTTTQVAANLAYAQVILRLSEKHPRMELDPENAIQALETVLEIDPGNLEARALLAEALAGCKKYDQALEAYQEIFDTGLLNDADWSYRLAIGMVRTALALEKPDIAIATLQDVIANHPDVSLPYRLLAESYVIAQLPEHALQAAQSALSLKEDDITTTAWIVTLLKQLLSENTTGTQKTVNLNMLNRVLEDSIETIQTIIQTRPEHISLAISLGELLLLAGDSIASRKAYLLIANSNFAQPYDLKSAAEHLFALDDTKGGIACLQRAVELETVTQGVPSIESLLDLALAYKSIGSTQMALKIFDQAIQIQPSNPDIYIAKAQLLLESRQTQEALTCLQQAMAQAPSSYVKPDIHFMIALAYLAEGNLPASFDHSRRALVAFQEQPREGSIRSHPGYSTEYHPLTFYTLAAELARELLQPEDALKYLKDCQALLTSESLSQTEYVAFFCLYNELNLEAEGKIVQDIAFPSPILCATGHPRLLSLNARLANWKGDPDQAKEFLKAAKEAIEQPDGTKTPRTQITNVFLSGVSKFLSIADAAIDLRDWESAATYLRKAINQSPTNPLALLSLARFFILQAEYQDLCNACQVIRHSPGPEASSESAYRGLRNALTSLHQLMNDWQNQMDQLGLSFHKQIIDRWQARADMVFEKTLPTAIAIQKSTLLVENHENYSFLCTPDDIAAIIAASRRVAGQIDENENLDTVRQILHGKTPHPIMLLQMAMALAEHHLSDAINTCVNSTKYLGQEHNNIAAFCFAYLAYLYMQQGALPEALDQILIALDIWPDESRWNAMAANIKNQLGDHLGAIHHLEEAIKFEPGNVKHYLDLGHIYLKAIQVDQHADRAIFQKRAIRALERATRLTPQDPQIWFALAQAHFQTGDMNQANQCVDQALDFEPNHYHALALKAEIALETAQPDAARDYAKKAIAVRPDLATAHIIHARALELLKHPDEALQALEKAVNTSDDPLPLQLEHAGLVKQMHGSQSALAELLSIQQNFPDDPVVLADLSLAYADCDQADSAIQTAQKSLQVGANSLPVSKQASLHLVLGRLLRKTGQLDQAVLHLHKASQLIPNDVEPYIELGLTYKERREYQQALQLFQQATAIAQTDPRPYYLAGLALKDGKDYRQSETMLRKAAGLAPQDVNIRRQLAAVVALNLVHNPNSVRVSVE